MLDLRVPSGLFFLLIGLILLLTGFIGSPSAPLASNNVDLWSGFAIFDFGAALLAISRRKR